MVKIGSVSKKWSDDILFALNDGEKRFNQLLKYVSDSENKISTRTLADRLKKLEDEDILTREIIQGRPPTTIYKLTNKGKKAVELIKKLNEL